MLTILLGILITSIICTILLAIASIFDGDGFIPFITVFGLVGIIASFILGIVYPFNGYTDWKLVEETELISLSNSTVSGGEGCIYVSLSADNAYTYRYEIDSDLGTDSSKEYETATIMNNVIEVEDPNCEVPTLKEYKRTAKKSIWTFGVYSETKYVFYVPEGTISKEINLK